MSSINPNPQYPQSGNLTSINFRPMDVNSPNQFQPPSSVFSVQNTIIFTLCILLLLTFLGINLLASMGNIVDVLSNIFGPLFTQILSVFGYTAGTVIDKSTDIVTDVAKHGIDLAGDTVQSAAD